MLPNTKTKSNWVDSLANILTIIVALVFLGLLVQRYVLPGEPDSKTPTIGNIVSVEGFNPAGYSKNVLLVLMKGCRFCEASVDFYKEVLAKSASQNRNVVVVFPPKTDEPEQYLAKLGLPGLPITFSALSDIEVDGTPTIIVTDEDGKIVGTWTGQLSKEKETEVLNFLAL